MERQKSILFVAVIAACIVFGVVFAACPADTPLTTETVATPTANPAAGEVTSGATISLSSETKDAEIWFTTDGTAPAKNGSTSTRYTTPVAITADVTIKAIAVKNGWHDSGILEAVYTVTVVGFIPVTGIDNVPATATVGKPLTLPSVGAPANADNKDVAWSVKGGAAISGDFNPNAEGVVTLTATIAHGLSDTEDFIQDYSIIVLKPADEVLWAWNKADQPWAALPNNPGGDNNVWSNGYSSWKSDAYLSVPVSIYATTGTNAQPVPADKDGMVVGGTSGGYGGQRFAIGITPGTATFGASGPYPKVGAFDLTHGILRVTVEYQNVKASAANRYLIRVAINNNSGTAANSPLGADSYIGNLNGGTLTSDDQVYDSFDSSTGLINRSSSEIVYSGSVIETYPGLSNDGRGAAVMTASPAVFYAQTGNSGIDSLANAFIQIMAQAGDAVGGDNYITWNSIKIERLNDPGEIIPVYDITASAVLSTVEGTPLTLDATVLPTIATNKTVTWSVSDAGTTGASFSGNTLNTTGPGTATVTATVSNGIAQGENFIKDFEITVFPNDAIIPVTGITGVSPELHLGTPLELTGVVAPASATNQTIVWSIDASDDGSAHPSVSGNILNATTAGTVKVLATIIDGIDDGVNYTHVFTIAVPDPNSIFEWIYSRDGGITAGTFTSTNAYITGKGPLGDLNVKVRSPDAATLNPPTVSMETEGIHINASGASTRVVIGYNSTTAVGILNTWFDNGTFDFSSATANGRWIQISAEYKIVTAATNTARFIHIQVNNNSNTAAATDSLLGVASRIGTLGPNPVLAAGTEDTFTAKFNPADFDSSADAKTSLNKAFIAIGGASGSGGYDFIIKSIKIEFVPAPTVQSVTITGPGVAGTPKALSVNLAGDPNKTVQLTGTIAPSDAVGTIVWTTDNAAYVDVDQTGQITAKQVTTNPVTITAMAGGKSDTVEVTVVDNSTAVDPNLIFEWTVADGEPAGMVWTNGSSAANSVSTAKLTGKGILTEVPISIASSTNNNDSIHWNNGISYGVPPRNLDDTRILVIGSGVGRSVASTASTAPAGVFNFYDIPDGKGIQVTLTVTGWVGGFVPDGTTTNANLSLFINNNTGTAGYTPAAPSTNAGSRIMYQQNSGAVSGANGSFSNDTDTDTGIYKSKVFKLADFTGGTDTLKTAFLGLIHSSTPDPHYFVITGIRIEYVDLP